MTAVSDGASQPPARITAGSRDAALSTLARRDGEASNAATEAPDDPVGALRLRIDQLDERLIDAWRERARLSAEIGRVRVASGGTRLALSREQHIIDQYRRELGPTGARLALLLLEAGRGEL